MCLYLIDPTSTKPSISNDDGAGNSQAKITAMLEPGIHYLLLTTTYDINQSGSFRLYTGQDASIVSSNEMTIKDVGDMGNPYCFRSNTSLTGYSIGELKAKGYKSITFTITMDVKEIMTVINTSLYITEQAHPRKNSGTKNLNMVQGKRILLIGVIHLRLQ